MPNEKDKELDKILSEVKENKEKTEETKKEDYAERKKKKKKNKRQQEQNRKEQQKKNVQKKPQEEKGALDIEDEPLAFAKHSKIVESESEGEIVKQKPAKKHIEVGAAEVIEDEPSAKEEKHSEKAVLENDEKPVYTKVEIPKTARSMKKKASKKQRKTALLGLLMSIFVIIGVVTTLVGLFNAGKYILTSAAKKEEFAKVVYPLVIVDAPEFEDPTRLDSAVIISSSIWDFLLSDVDKSKYERDDFGSIFVPSTDIEAQIRKLYGNDVVIKHQTIDDGGIIMLYDSENDKYIIESSPKYVSYIPKVDKITRKDDVYTLKVSYVIPDAMWNLHPDSTEQTVVKVNEFKIKKTKSGYQFLSSKLVEVVGFEKLDENNASEDVSFDYESFENEMNSDLESRDETVPTDVSEDLTSGEESGESSEGTSSEE